VLARAFWTMSPPINSRRERTSEGLLHWAESWLNVPSGDVRPLFAGQFQATMPSVAGRPPPEGA
jgi:hypothetical protein